MRGSRNARSDSQSRTLLSADRDDEAVHELERSEVTLLDLPALPGVGQEDPEPSVVVHGEITYDEHGRDDAAFEDRASDARWGEAREASPSEGGREGPPLIERRLTATLLRIFARRRAQIGLSLDQLARLSGISIALLHTFDDPPSGQTITYDQVVVLSRVLGVPPDEMPGLRRRESRAHLGVTLAELERTLLAAPLLRYEGAHGERYGGDVERAAASKAFTVRVEDDSLAPIFSRGMLLGFMNEARPRVGGVVLLRHRRSSLLALRRHEPPAYSGLCAWQPSYVVGGEWHLCGTLEVVLPPR